MLAPPMLALLLAAAPSEPPVASSPVAVPATADARDEAPDDDEVRRLFLAACARCHGPEGDGDGEAAPTLDRPARSFRAGGFSFGNTVEALQRTIAAGIPGSPMPAFAEVYDDARLRALAEYVRTLGPADGGASEGGRSAVLVPDDRPLVVRGHLPPITGTTPSRPRGLLVGLPGAAGGGAWTLEYRTDDLRLLGVRRGGFVERSDWTGRGGTALTVLGDVVRLVQKGDPASPWALRHDDGRWERLTARMTGTRVGIDRSPPPEGVRPDFRGHAVRVLAELVDARGTLVAEVEETWTVPIDGRLDVGFVVRRADDGALPLLRRWEAAPGALNGLTQRRITGEDGFPWIEFAGGAYHGTPMSTFVTADAAGEAGR